MNTESLSLVKSLSSFLKQQLESRLGEKVGREIGEAPLPTGIAC